MRVDQAIYGEVRNGHSLRAASGNHEFAAELAPRMDLPDTAPPGVAWSPYVSGFAVGDYYVVARTFLDEAAPRGGMVLTHALFAPLESVCSLSNLAPLFERLIPTCQAPTNLVALDLPDASEPQGLAPDLFGAANALTSQGSGPVVRVGIQGFEQLVNSLWANLWDEARRTFSFRLSFGPADIAAERAAPTIVCTPQELRAPWTKFRVISADDKQPNSRSAALLAGGHEAVPLLNFVKEFGVKLEKLSELSIAERASDVLKPDADFEALLTAVRLTQRLSPDSTVGAPAKCALLARLIVATRSASSAQLALLRNLSLSAFSDTPGFWAEVQRRLATRMFPAGGDALEIELLTSAGDENVAVQAWREAAIGAFIEASRRRDAELVRALWRWSELDSAAFKDGVRLLPQDKSTELILANEAPSKLRPLAPETVLSVLASRKWLSAHGAAASAMLTPLEAVRRQLDVDRDLSWSDGLKLALRSSTPPETVECALAFDDTRLTSFAAQAASKRPAVLRDLDFKLPRAQAIWAATLATSPSRWDAPASPARARDEVLDNLLAGAPVSQELLAALADSPLADLGKYARREHAWASLPGGSRPLYQRATAQAWLAAAVSEGIPFAAEIELQAAVLSLQTLDSVLQSPSTGVASALSVISALRSFDERRFSTWLQAALGSHATIGMADAQAMGQLMLDRGWRRTIRDVATRYGHLRRDLRPTLSVCGLELSWWERWKYGVHVPNREEKWRAFIEEAARLYPGGPDHDQLWSRADGENSKLPHGQSGAARWQMVGLDLRNGRHPGAWALLAVMRRDFPSNEALTYFASDVDIVGRQ